MAIGTEINLPDGSGGFDAFHPETDVNQVLGLGLRRLTAYAVGDTCLSKNLKITRYLECTTAGTTAKQEPNLAGVAVGATINDGSVVWKVKEFANTTEAIANATHANAAEKLQNTRTINIQDASGTNTGTGASFDGSGNVTIKLPATIKASITGDCSGKVNGHTVNADVPANAKFTDTTYSAFVKSGSTAAAGLVPSPGTTAGTTKYLREDGTWAVPPDNNTTYSTMTASEATTGTGTTGRVITPKVLADYVSDKVAGVVNSAPATLDTLKELADALGSDPNFATTITTALGNKLDSTATAVNAAKVNNLTVQTAVPANAKFTDTTYSAFVKSGSTAAAGLVPKPSTTAGTTKYLCEDGTWKVPPDNNTTYSTFVKSGSGAAAGLVPAPGTTAGTTKYLREDGTWQVPPDNNTTYTAASATPLANGTAAVGTSSKYAREDHVHPLQTSVSGSSGSCTGNAATATKLAAAKTINIQDASATNTGTGASFDGSGNATIKLPATIKASLTGNCSGSSGSCTGNAATATKINSNTIVKVSSFDANTGVLTLTGLS